MAEITGKDLISWGFEPGAWFPGAIEAANRAAASGAGPDAVRAAAAACAPPPPTVLRAEGALPYHRNIEAASELEARNVEAVDATMRALMRTPTLVAGAIMPDACPSGAVGAIPVGGVVAAKGAIHPGLHSADICCSVAISVLGDVDPMRALDVAQAATHFGGGGRVAGQVVPPPDAVLARFAGNRFLEGLEGPAVAHFATQGDGNHFLFVGRLRSSGAVAMVTHHGSRKPGAMLYKRGMEAAERLRRRIAPEVAKSSAWIEAESADGEAYWQALQVLRGWTKASHFAIHDRTLAGLGLTAPLDRFWNEHNFVFRRGDLYYHAKGATPAYPGFAADALWDDPEAASGRTLVPLNMAAPVLIMEGADAAHGLGFAPHGAGRNVSRSAHLRRIEGRPAAAVLAEETAGVDARFYCGVPDLSELPSAYKSAEQVTAQIARFGLGRVVDAVEPIGSIMAGDWTKPFHAERQAAKKARDAGRDAARRDKRGRGRR